METLARDESRTTKQARRHRGSLKLAVILAVTIAVLCFVVFSTVVSDTMVRLARNMIDRQQYGKSYSVVRIRGELLGDMEVRASGGAKALLHRYKQVLERIGRYASWPKIENFADHWRVSERESLLPNRSIWWTTGRTPRKILIFIHGGATFAGSPHKHNNLHWLQTIGWIAHMTDRFTDIVSVDYRLQPEHTIDDSVHDCARAFHDAIDGREPPASVDLIGFSAGGMYAALLALLLESAATDERNVAAREYIDPGGTWSRVRETRLHLISPLARLDRLFVNGAIDISPLLLNFSRTFFNNAAHHYDPLFQLALLNSPLRRAFRQIHLYDVSRNSLSNHAISLAELLRKLGRTDDDLFVWVYDERHMLVDNELSRRIYEYELKIGRKPSKYLQRYSHQPPSESRDAGSTANAPDETNNPFYTYSPSTKYRNANPANFIHYHFFMYILPCSASWETMANILQPRPLE